VEAYGGFEQRGGLPLSTSRFEADGIWRGSRSGYDPSLYPPFQPAAIAPAVGGAIESTGVTWIHGRLSYRRVYNTGSSNVTEFVNPLGAMAVPPTSPASYDGSRISTEKLGYSMDASIAHLGGVKGGVVYDFSSAQVTSIYGSLDGYIGPRVTVSADYDYYVPTFDGDSIWTIFAAEPMNDIGLRANVDATNQLSVSGGVNRRIFGVPTQPEQPGGKFPYVPYVNFAPGQQQFPSNGHPFDDGGNLSVRWHRGSTLVALRGAGNWGDEGNRVGADVSGQEVFETRYVASARAGVWEWKDMLRPDRNATSLQYVLGLAYRFTGRSQAGVEWEHDINRLAGQRFRFLLSLSLAVGK
jgi:hypothetical protein